jgi:uncharacterized protein (DUF433 family)
MKELPEAYLQLDEEDIRADLDYATRTRADEEITEPTGS